MLIQLVYKGNIFIYKSGFWHFTSVIWFGTLNKNTIYISGSSWCPLRRLSCRIPRNPNILAHVKYRVSFVYVCFVIELSESTKRIHQNKSHHLKNYYLFIMWLDHTEQNGKNGSIKFTFYTHVGSPPLVFVGRYSNMKVKLKVVWDTLRHLYQTCNETHHHGNHACLNI